MLLTVLQNLPLTQTTGTTESTDTSKPSSTTTKEKQSVLSFLSELNHELKDLKHTGNPSVEEISKVSAKIFRASIQSDKRLAQLSHERELIQHYVNGIWNHFESMVTPLWKLDDEMMPLYQNLVSIDSDLDGIQQKELTPTERLQDIHDCQVRLNELESNFYVDGKFVPEGWSKMGGRIPSGQAILIQLMNKCYKKCRSMLSFQSECWSKVDPVLFDIRKKLEHLISELWILLDSTKQDLAINPYELAQLQEQLDAIDSSQVDGKFLDTHGNVPSGQGELHLLLEKGYDLVHQCLIFIENLENEQRSTLSELGNEMFQVSESLWGLAKSSSEKVVSLSRGQLNYFGDALSKGTDTVKSALASTTKSVDATVSHIANLCRSGLNQMYAELEPVDESLSVVQTALHDIRSALYETRKSFNSFVLKSRMDKEPVTYKVKINAFKKNLDDLFESLKRVDASQINGQWMSNEVQEIPIGQDHLHAVLDECYCLLYELGDRIESL